MSLDAAIAASASTGGRVNKAELAAILKTSLPTLDKMLRQHGDAFPVVRRGTNGVEYQFDPAAVLAFLGDLEEQRIAAGRAQDDLMQQYTLPNVTPPEDAAIKPADRLKLAQLRQIERRELIESGFLVERAAARQALADAFMQLRRDTARAVRQSLQDANIPDPVIRTIESRIADAQRSFVDKTQKVLSDPSETPSHGEPTLL